MRCKLMVAILLIGASSMAAAQQTEPLPANAPAIKPAPDEAPDIAPATTTELTPADAALPQPPAADPPASAMPMPAMDASRAAPADTATAPTEEQTFARYRHDLINLLALRADPDLLIAAAQLAYADSGDNTRPAALKTPSLLRRAQKYGDTSVLVWWISAFLECTPTSVCPAPQVAQKLEQIDGDNIAAWLPALSTEKNADKAHAILASMAQAKRFDDYWATSVLAVYRALETLPVPGDVIRQGINGTAARINFATSVGGGFIPHYQSLTEICRPLEGQDASVTSQCLGIARALQSGGTFISQAIGFTIEEKLVVSGALHDVLIAHKRTASWQKQKFLELSTRFPRDQALAQGYVEALRAQHSELGAVTAMLREEHISYDPPADWQPPDSIGAPLPDPLAPPKPH